jgi:hypothetical protein
MTRGDVVIVEFPFADGRRGKIVRRSSFKTIAIIADWPILWSR